MRVVAYCPPEHTELVRTSIGVDAELHETWPPFEKAVRGADCAVVVMEWLNRSPGVTELNELRMGQPWTRFVIVTRVEGENPLLAPQVADSIVWLPHVRDQVNRAILLTTNGLRYELVRTLSSTSRLSRWMRKALMGLLEADPAPTTVADWAGLKCVSSVPRTLRYHFAREFHSGVNPKFVVTAGLLLYGLDRFCNVATWPAMAACMDVNAARLAAMATRLAGEPATHPTDVRRSSVVRTFALLLQ